MTHELNLNGHCFSHLLETANAVADGTIPNAKFSHLNLVFIPRTTLALLQSALERIQAAAPDNLEFSIDGESQTAGWFEDTDILKASVNVHLGKFNSIIFLNRNLAAVNSAYYALLQDAFYDAKDETGLISE